VRLKETRKRLTMIAVALAVLDVAAIGLLFSPLVGSKKDRLSQLEQLIQESKQKQQQVDRVGNIDQKISTAQQQVTAFYRDRVPDRDSAISESLGKLAAESGVKIEQAKYNPKTDTQAGLRMVEIEASLSGQYPQLARFVNSLERDQPVFFIVDSIDLAGQQTNTVRLEVKLRTFLKTGA
jgi:Tfp pilus assembly protein PilO